MQVCKEIDGFVLDTFDTGTRWIVMLSNGEKIYQDDYRPEVEPKNAWERLGQYVRANNLSITSMSLHFRSHAVQVNDGPVDGFFFCRASLGAPGFVKTLDYYIAGTLKNGILETKRYQIPDLELDLEGIEIRDPDKAGICLIRNQ